LKVILENNAEDMIGLKQIMMKRDENAEGMTGI